MKNKQLNTIKEIIREDDKKRKLSVLIEISNIDDKPNTPLLSERKEEILKILQNHISLDCNIEVISTRWLTKDNSDNKLH